MEVVKATADLFSQFHLLLDAPSSVSTLNKKELTEKRNALLKRVVGVCSRLSVFFLASYSHVSLTKERMRLAMMSLGHSHKQKNPL